MPRPSTGPTTHLGRRLIERRGSDSLFVVAEATGLSYSTLSNIELGTHAPSYPTAVKLAAWLGWTTDEVMAAANQPGPSPDSGWWPPLPSRALCQGQVKG